MEPGLNYLPTNPIMSPNINTFKLLSSFILAYTNCQFYFLNHGKTERAFVYFAFLLTKFEKFYGSTSHDFKSYKVLRIFPFSNKCVPFLSVKSRIKTHFLVI